MSRQQGLEQTRGQIVIDGVEYEPFIKNPYIVGGTPRFYDFLKEALNGEAVYGIEAADAFKALIAEKGNLEAAIASVSGKTKEYLKLLRGRDISLNKKPGQLYEAEIPEDSVMLHWDRAFTEQPRDVQKALKAAGIGGSKNKTGAAIYKELSQKKKSRRVASEYLNSLGIKGIKYLDGFSRAEGEGSYNYVIFDEEAIRILDTYYQLS